MNGGRSLYQEGGGRLASPAATRTSLLTVGDYFPQQPEPPQPEPQHSSAPAFTPAAGHSSTQHSQVQLVHLQTPVSQQPQHSHFGQPAVGPAVMAETEAARPSAAQSRKPFMGKPLAFVKPESIDPRHDA